MFAMTECEKKERIFNQLTDDLGLISMLLVVYIYEQIFLDEEGEDDDEQLQRENRVFVM